MCRKNQLWGCCAITFGLGLLVGGYIASGFWCFCGGLLIIAVGFSLFQKKA